MWKCFHFWWIFWIIFVGFVTGIAQVSESGQGVYPYAYIQDVKPPFYTKFRAEGAIAFSVAMHFMHYSLKYKFKNTISVLPKGYIFRISKPFSDTLKTKKPFPFLKRP